MNQLWVGGHQARRLQVTRRAKIVTHTEMTVFEPWSSKLEETWELPKGAVAGSLLRDEKGAYLAVLEWPSELACDTWLANQKHAAKQLAKQTVKYSECAAGAAGAASKASGGDSEASQFQQKLQQMQQAALASDRPEVDPKVLFAISAGEDVDIDLEDEVLISGGDPSFLDDQRLSAESVNLLEVGTTVY